MTEMERKLEEVRRKRDIGLSQKKRKEIELLQAGKFAGLDFQSSH